MNKSINIAVLASGSGSNAEQIAKFFAEHDKINCRLLISNNKTAGVFKRFEKFPKVKTAHLSNTAIRESKEFITLLESQEIDFVILAGFMLKIPEQVVASYPNRIINIHPALLPKYGGKGMYGHFVHEAVIEHKEKESGITIHQVNEAYDEGAIIFQTKCGVTPEMTPEQLAAKVQQLEHQHFPKVIEGYILNTIRS